jgi:hypothetical protein
MANKSYYFIITILFVLLIFLKIGPEQSIDWRETYAYDESIPYGTEILYDYLNSYQKRKMELSLEPLYNMDLDSQQIFIVSSSITTDRLDIDKMIDFAENGGQVFLSSRSFSKLLLDTFNLKLDADLQDADSSLIILNLDAEKYEYNFSYRPRYFLGKFSMNDTSKVNDGFITVSKSEANTDYWIKKTIGKGSIHFHSFPYVFSNYFLMQEKTRAYVEKMLQKFDQKNFLWLQYYSTGRKEIRSPMRYLLEKEELRKALYLTIASVLIFMIFSLKRKAAAIPIIKKPENASLDFIKTLGLLLYQQRKHRLIAIKRFKHFLDFNRKHYYIHDWVVSEQLFENLSKKSAVDYSKIKLIFERYAHIKSALELSKEDLISFNGLLEEYYKLNTYKKELVS